MDLQYKVEEQTKKLEQTKEQCNILNNQLCSVKPIADTVETMGNVCNEFTKQNDIARDNIAHYKKLQKKGVFSSKNNQRSTVYQSLVLLLGAIIIAGGCFFVQWSEEIGKRIGRVQSPKQQISFWGGR